MTDEMCGSTNSPLAPFASMESFTTTTSRIDRGKVFKRKKKPSRKLRDTFGQTPLSLEEDISWKCRRLVVGTGTRALPVYGQSEG